MPATDNYQGEESDIVIASLTRNNETGDIGFMSAPERLNVLMTRARNGIVLIGNMATFMQSKKGRHTWHPFFELLKAKGHLYDGLPVYCGKHPSRTALLKEPIDFDKSCPDGGCTELWYVWNLDYLTVMLTRHSNAALKCGVHKCTSRCHRVVDHSKTECNQLVGKLCERQHKTRVRCGKERDGCRKCILEDQEMERRAKRDLQLEEERARREESYKRELQEIDDEIDHQRRVGQYGTEAEKQKQTLKDRKSELEALKQKAETAAKAADIAKKIASMKGSAQVKQPPSYSWTGDSGARTEWEFLKQSEGAHSKPLDDLMQMIGLEEVKQKFLGVKSKVDTALRQGISMASERFSCSMLGNPGTGKSLWCRVCLVVPEFF